MPGVGPHWRAEEVDADELQPDRELFRRAGGRAGGTPAGFRGQLHNHLRILKKKKTSRATRPGVASLKIPAAFLQ